MEYLVPTEFYLCQNYPNPFKERTITKYCVPERMKIRSEVFDTAGNKVMTLVDEINYKLLRALLTNVQISTYKGEPD